MTRNTPACRRPTRRLIGVLIAALLTVSGAAAAVPAAAASEATIFGSEKPAVAAHDDSAAVELGVAVVPNKDGAITGIRFYKGSGNSGTHTGSLWNASGTRLATATFSGETASGWQEVRFSSAVAVTKGTRYVASYYAPRGRYAAASNAFAKALTRGDLTVPANGGVYRYGTSGYPTSSYKASNYYVDVLYSPTDSTPLSVVSATPRKLSRGPSSVLSTSAMACPVTS